jgi:hypothetical protein
VGPHGLTSNKLGVRNVEAVARLPRGIWADTNAVEILGSSAPMPVSRSRSRARKVVLKP